MQKEIYEILLASLVLSIITQNNTCNFHISTHNSYEESSVMEGDWGRGLENWEKSG